MTENVAERNKEIKRIIKKTSLTCCLKNVLVLPLDVGQIDDYY